MKEVEAQENVRDRIGVVLHTLGKKKTRFLLFEHFFCVIFQNKNLDFDGLIVTVQLYNGFPYI